MEDAEAAILVRNARKQYSKSSRSILDDLNMTVPKGTIYGLLGASGCGKTTLLSCILGTRKLQAGYINVLGQRPGRAAVKSIGYMPQDIALVGELTVKGAVKHYGWIFGMNNDEIEDRFEFLSDLLDLPPSDKLVKNLSGGQQRRVSLAVVLIHNPQLLILDEPTVGLDPVLRHAIWNYLVNITEIEKKTIVITTHYIEEANQAHQIGLMRHGKILEEGQPQMLMSKYQCQTIEEVFVYLSTNQQEDTDGMGISELHSIPGIKIEDTTAQTKEMTLKSLWDGLSFTNGGHARALLSKNFLRFQRHPGTIMFAFLLPVLEMITFFWAIGTVPNDIKIGIVNEELGNYTDCAEYKTYNPVGGHVLEDNLTCTYNGLGCRFVENLGEKLQTKIYFKTKEEAMEATKKGTIHNFVYFPHNFSEAVTIVRNATEFSDKDLDFREINIFTDSVDRTLSEIISKELYDTYKRYAETLATDCNTNPHSERIPIRFETPIYGSENLTYRDLIAPGMIALVAVFLAMAISSSTITTERTEGIWERTVVSGVTPTEILIFHTLTLCCVSILQILELFVIAFYVFGLECKGDKFTVFLLIYLQSLAGICLGILISVITRNVSEANYVSIGLFYPFLTMAGCFWPIEGMPNFLRSLSYFVPLTITSQSLSSVIHRGWSLTHFHVFRAFLTSIGFIGFFTTISAIILKRENK